MEHYGTDQWIGIVTAAGTWAAAIGTIVAVFAAIHLARRMEKVRLQITSSEMVAITSDQGVVDKYLEIKITNIGLNTVILDKIAFGIGRGNKKMLITTLDFLLPANEKPQLDFGQNHIVTISYKERPNWKANFINEALKHGSLRSLRICVTTSTGFTKRVRPNRNFTKSLRKIKGEMA